MKAVRITITKDTERLLEKAMVQQWQKEHPEQAKIPYNVLRLRFMVEHCIDFYIGHCF